MPHLKCQVNCCLCVPKPHNDIPLFRQASPPWYPLRSKNQLHASPEARARSTAASVCPGRTITPPCLYRSGKMCPGLLKSSGCELGSAIARSVAARSAAEIPVEVPLRRSTVTVNAVYMDSSFSVEVTMRGSFRRSMSAPSMEMQICEE
jgi:hypothetical protein